MRRGNRGGADVASARRLGCGFVRLAVDVQRDVIECHLQSRQEVGRVAKRALLEKRLVRVACSTLDPCFDTVLQYLPICRKIGHKSAAQIGQRRRAARGQVFQRHGGILAASPQYHLQRHAGEHKAVVAQL